ncbi:MAG: hypothetical protein ABIL62_08240 [Planctomycetota bacterium]
MLFPSHICFAQEYADSYGVSIGAVLLFGPRGGATMELLHFLAAERVHGMHRNGISPNPYFSKETRKMWYSAQRSYNWPRMVDEHGQEVSMDVAEERGQLPEGIVAALRELWRRNPAPRNYMGIYRHTGIRPGNCFMVIPSRFGKPRMKSGWLKANGSRPGA